MFTSTSGIVLRTHPFKDRLFIAKIFTKECGLISCCVRKNKTQGILSEPLTIANIIYKNSKTNSLVYLKEAHVEYVYKTLSSNAQKIQSSIILCEILSKCLAEKNEDAYDFIINAFKYLDSSSILDRGFDSYFLIKFCQLMGISPLSDKLKSINNPTLNIRSGIFQEYFQNMKKHPDFVPPVESREIYRLSQLTLGELKLQKTSEILNKKIFNYMILYVSQHLADIRNLKSLRVICELAD